MTAQSRDIFTYKKQKYNLSGEEYIDSPFDIYSFGFKPFSPATSLHRGYIASFAKNRNRQLILRNLSVFHEDSSGQKAPKINGKYPEIIEEVAWLGEVKGDRFYYEYKNVDLSLDYTGRLLISEGRIGRSCIHKGLQSSASYETVIELTFKNGLFIRKINLFEMALSLQDQVPLKNGQKVIPEGDALWEWLYEQYCFPFEHGFDRFK